MTSDDRVAWAALSLIIAMFLGCGRVGFDAIPTDGSFPNAVDSGARDAASLADGGGADSATPREDGGVTSARDAGSIPTDGSTSAADGGTETPIDGASCRDILAASPGAADGTYTVSLPGLGTTLVACDMTTDGGGWTLILSYVHQAMTTPAPVARAASFPLLGTATMGDDGSTDSTSWGHARPSLLALIPFGELRFFCRSSDHARTLHFVTDSVPCASYMRTGSGYCSDLLSTTRLLADHTAMLPLSATHVTGAAGDFALTTNPFYDPGTLEWLMNGAEWECDGSVAARAHTIHRVWAR